MQPSHPHPFDRYAPYTDVAALKAISNRRLRKSLRVNTLKMSVTDFETYAQKKGWMLSPVPWCREAFFIERLPVERPTNIPAEGDEPYYGEAIGRDILHLLGHFYIQEAASMLPPALLEPCPHELIFDMSAAPGSKTTQMSARMGGRGVIVANDVQEHRLWTLRTALNRLGNTNVVMTKKVGQWFAGHMTERFDRVLCDAPCTAQGTARKDSDALKYCSMENVEKMARLQTTLLESAIHAAKVGGRIVYSTCTLTPEENEGVVRAMLQKFEGQVSIVDPRTLTEAPDGFWERPIADSLKVQGIAFPDGKFIPCIRLWPQTFDTEGFFCAVLEKTAPTRAPMELEMVHFQERELPRSRRDEIGRQILERYGASFLHDDDRLFAKGESAILAPVEIALLKLPLQDYLLGLPFGKRLEDGRVLLHHELVTLRGAQATKNVVEVDEAQVVELLKGHDTTCDASARGHVILKMGSVAVGHGLAKEGKLKNNLPRWMMQN